MDSLSQKSRRIHFVGIGGVGMSGIAQVLLNLGHRVSGSDMVESEATRRLVQLGAQVTCGHSAEAITAEIDVVVMSSAAKYSNPEILRARELRIPVIPRAEMLAELMRMKSGIAVAGTHGKTTTTSLISTILRRAELDPTVVIGGKVHGFGSNAQLGAGDLMVAEADESDGTFLLLSPTLAVVTNIEPEHLDFYGDMNRVRDAYLQFINRIPFYGAAVVCLDDVVVRGLIANAKKRVITYGFSPDADYVACNVMVSGMCTHFSAEFGGESLGEFVVRMPGRHNALNALAAIAVGRQLGVSLDVMREALAEFGGIHRRFEICGEVGGVMVVTDYAHHPSEIRATIAAARDGFERRVVVLFQPHRFSRLRDLFTEFLDAFDSADKLFLTDVYAAGEEPIEGVNGEVLHFALKRRGHLDLEYVADVRELVKSVVPQLRNGDLVLLLGAGSIYRLGEQLTLELSGAHSASLLQ